MRNLFISFLSTGFIQLANLATGILAARLLHPEGRGELALLVLWAVLVANLGSMGLHTAVTYTGARRETAPSKIFASMIWLSLALSPVLMGVYAIVVETVFAGQRPAVLSMAWIYMAMIPIYLCSHALVSQFQGEQRFGRFNLLRPTVHVAYLVFILAALAAGAATVTGFATAYLAATAASGLAALVMAVQLGWARLVPDFRVMREMFLYGLRSHVGTVLFIANSKLDQLVISVVLAVGDLGLYVVAVTVAGIPLLIASTTDMLAFPKMTEQDSEEDRRAVLGRYLRATLCLVLPAIAVLVVIAPELIALVFGRSFLPAANVARVLLLSAVPLAFRVFLASYLRAGDRMLILGKVEAVAVAVAVAALGVLVPLFGTMGAALAQLAATTLPVVVCIALIRREQPFDLVALLTPQQRDVAVFRDALARWKTRG